MLRELSALLIYYNIERARDIFNVNLSRLLKPQGADLNVNLSKFKYTGKKSF